MHFKYNFNAIFYNPAVKKKCVKCITRNRYYKYFYPQWFYDQLIQGSWKTT